MSEKIKAGDPLKIKASDWNKLVELTARRADLSASELIQQQAYPTNVVLIRNDTEQTLERFAVVGLDEPIILPDSDDVHKTAEFKRAVQFVAVVPDPELHTGKFAIVLQPLEQNKIGSAVIAGVTVAKVRFVPNSNPPEFCDVELDNVTSLVSGGSARILWVDDVPIDPDDADSEEPVDHYAVIRIEAGGQETFIARLVGKTYSANYRAYSWIKLQDSSAPAALSYTDTDFGGGNCVWRWDGAVWLPIGGACVAGCDCSYPAGNGTAVGDLTITACGADCTGAAYHEFDVDLAVPQIVRLRKGRGNYYLIEQLARVEFVRKVGPPFTLNGIEYIPGALCRYDQVTKSIIEESDILIRDLTN